MQAVPVQSFTHYEIGTWNEIKMKWNEMKYIPYKRGVLRTSFPLWGVTILWEMVVVTGGGYSGSNLLCGVYHVMAVVGCMGGCIGGCLITRCAVGCSPSSVGVLLLPVVCSLIFCCLCAMMPRSLVWVRVHNLSRSAFAVRVSWRRAVLLISGVLCPFCFLVAAM